MKNKTVDMAYAKMTPEQFKGLIASKGWTQEEVAALFGKSRIWLNTISADPDRSAHYDFAVMGLPAKRTFARDLRLLRDRIEAWILKKPAPRRREKKLGPEYRYRGYMVSGAIVTASDDIGSIAEVGTRGIVFQVEDQGAGVGERYGVIFETGAYEWFLPANVDTYLATTGLFDPELTDYKHSDIRYIVAKFGAGNLTFWPA